MAKYKVTFTYETYVDEVTSGDEAIEVAYYDFEKNFNKSAVKTDFICE